MPDFHMSMLALDVPNVLPKSVPWISYSAQEGLHINDHSEWVRNAGRLIWSSLIFTAGAVIAYAWTKKPKRSAESATWASTILGAMAVWGMMALGYGTIPHEWATFGNSYLNFNSATYLMRQNRFIHFDINRAVVVDAGVTVIYGLVVVLQVWLFVRWQKRPVLEPGVVESPEVESAPGRFSRLRRREKRVSAYGRPVTTSES